MSARIELEANGKRYICEYNRASVRAMEQHGLQIGDDASGFVGKFVTATDVFIWGALVKNHPDIPFEKIDEVVEELQKEYDILDLVNNLSEMATESIPNGDTDSKPKKAITIIR